MFLNRLRENNPALIDFARYALRRGELPPNTYILDRCAIRENAQAMLNTAKENNVHLYFMLKQLGRNPLIGQMLDELGFDGAVAVDADEALSYLKNGVHLAARNTPSASRASRRRTRRAKGKQNKKEANTPCMTN